MRRGIQLIELLIGMTTTSILLAGVFASIRISQQAYSIANERGDGAVMTTSGLDLLRMDLAEGSPISDRSNSTVSMTVPDRDGDNSPETISYQWLGADTPLQRSVNGGPYVNATEKLAKLDLQFHDSVPQDEKEQGSLYPSEAMEFQGHTVKAESSGSGLTIDIPASYWPGDLLVMAVAIDQDTKDKGAAPAEWIKVLERNRGSDVSLCVWYTFAPASSSVAMTWDKTGSAYATIAHFKIGNVTPTLVDSKDHTGDSKDVEAPDVNCTADHSLVVRMFAGDGPLVGEDATNMIGHTPITMRRQLFRDPIIGMACKTYPSGSIPKENFVLSQKTKFVAASIVFQP